MLIPQRFYEAVVPISLKEQNEQWESSGTGFLYAAQRVKDGKPFQLLFFVTNKHNFQDPKGKNIPWMYLGFDVEGEGPGASIPLDLLNEEGMPDWTTRNGIDVAVMTINREELTNNKIRYSYFDGDDHAMTLTAMQEKNCYEGESVFVLGFPAGIPESYHNYAVARKGILARIRDTYKTGYPYFFVESLISKGNSGSPVILQPTGFRISDGPTETRIIGIISDYYLQKNGKPRQSIEEHTGLCTVWTIDAIESLMDDHIQRFPGLVPE